MARKIRRAKFRPIPEEDYADSPKAKTFVNEVPKDSGLGKIYSYRYKNQKSDDDFWPDPKRHLPKDHHLRTGKPAPTFDHTFEDPNSVPQSEIDELADFKSGYRRITPKQYKEPNSKSGYRRITPKQWKPSQKSTSSYTGFTKVKVPDSTGFTKIKVPKFTGLNGLKLPSKPVKKKVKGEVDLFGPTKVKFIPPTYLDRETKGFDTGVPKGITRKDLGLKDKPKLKKSYGAPKPGSKFLPKKGGPYSNAQHDQLVKSDIKVGGADLRLKSMAAIGALGAGAIGLGRVLPRLRKILPKRPKYTTKGTPNPKDPMNIIHTPPIPKLLKRPVKTKAPKLKTPKSIRAEDYVTRRTAKELYKRIFPKGKYDGKIVKTPKKVLKKFQNRKK